MPKFYFDVFDGNKALQDDFGDVFSIGEDPTAQAVGLLTGFASDIAPGDGAKDFGVAVRDDSGHDIYRAALVFRDNHPDPASSAGPCNSFPAVVVPNPVDLIQHSRETRAAAEQLARRVAMAASDLQDMFDEVDAMARQMQAEMVAREGRGAAIGQRHADQASTFSRLL